MNRSQKPGAFVTIPHANSGKEDHIPEISNNRFATRKV